MPAFWIQVEDLSGTLVGEIRTATRATVTRRLDQAGTVSVEGPATDSATALYAPKRVVHVKSVRVGAVVDFGAGIVDSIGTPGSYDPVLTVGGSDLLAELTNRTVGALLCSDGAGGPSATALADVLAFAPTGWSYDVVAGYGSTLTGVYFQFAGESVLAALVKIAELTGEHFCLGAGRTIIWRRTDQPASGLRAIYFTDPVAAETNPEAVLILEVTQTQESTDLYTWIYPTGGGNASAALTLADTTRSAPAGYTLNAAANWLRNDTAIAVYGRIERPVVYTDVVALGTSTTDKQSASNALFDTALAALRRASAPQYTYTLRVAKVDAELLPGQTIRVLARRTTDGFVWLAIATDLLILETVTEIDEVGVRLTGLTVSTTDHWPLKDVSVLAQTIRTVASLSNHRQPASGTSGGGAVISGVTATAPLASSGGTAPVISHNASALAAGTVAYPASLTTDSKGHLTAATAGSAPVSGVTASSPLASSGGTAPNLTHSAIGTPGTYAYPASMTTDTQGHVSAVTAGSAPILPALPETFTFGTHGGGVQLAAWEELLTVAAAATTDTTATIPANSMVLSVGVYVVTAIPTAATFQIGVSGAANRYNPSGAGISTAAGTHAHNSGQTTITAYTAATAIRVTPNLTPGAATGQVRIQVAYIVGVEPTS